MIGQVVLGKDTHMVYYFNSCKTDDSYSLGFCLRDIIENLRKKGQPLVFLCIGTDRSTGDSLGPLIGHKLSKIEFENTFIYGTLNNPVHALNLEQVLLGIYKAHKNPLIIAIDAALGQYDHIGYITLANSPLSPGQGVKKNLPKVGDVSITGVVNHSGDSEDNRLSNTRLSIVMTLADSIVKGIRTSLLCL